MQGKYVRFHPVELPDSRVVRLNRLYPKSLYKARGDHAGADANSRRVSVPRLLATRSCPAWARQVIDGVIR